MLRMELSGSGVLDLSHHCQRIDYVKNLPRTCSCCEYHDTCVPCPLLTHGDKIYECEVSQKAIKDFETGILTSSIYKNIFILEQLKDNDQIILECDGRKFKISNTGYIIWQSIENNLPIIEVINTARAKNSEIPHEDIIDFLFDLRRMGLIYIRDDSPNNLPINCTLICCAR